MKRYSYLSALVCVLAVLCLTLSQPCAAQGITPNLGLQLPSRGAVNWNTPVNQNFVVLDSILGGTTDAPVGFWNSGRIATKTAIGLVKAPDCTTLGSNYFPQSLNSDGSWNCIQISTSGVISALGVNALGGVKGTGSSLTCPDGQVANGFQSDGTLNCVADSATDSTKLAITNNLSEIATEGSTAQSAARGNLGLNAASAATPSGTKCYPYQGTGGSGCDTPGSGGLPSDWSVTSSGSSEQVAMPGTLAVSQSVSAGGTTHTTIGSGGVTFPDGTVQATKAATTAHKRYRFFGFTGTSTDVFTTAESDDGATWTNTGGTWTNSTGGVNAPTCVPYMGQTVCHVAAADDANIHQKTLYFGTLSASNVYTNLVTLDWTSNISGLDTCFAGEFFVDDEGLIHLTVPCTTDSTYVTAWKSYESHPTNAAMTTWSAPVDMQISGAQMYDTTIKKIGNKYIALVSELNGTSTANFVQRIEMQAATSLTGPYTAVTSGDWAGWVASIGAHEGPNVYRLSNGSWRMMLERLSNHQMYYTDCAKLDFSTCGSGDWSTLTTWTEDQTYRHGSVVLLDTMGVDKTAVVKPSYTIATVTPSGSCANTSYPVQFVLTASPAVYLCGSDNQWHLSTGGTTASGFHYSFAITINHAKTTGTLTDFPIVVSHTNAYLKTAANGGYVQNLSGFDIVYGIDQFCSTRLSHEVDTYNASTGQVIAYVKVPNISSTTDTVIYQCFGNSSVTTTQENVADVWSNGYLAVWHLGSVTSPKDSVSGTTGTNHSATSAAGQVGNGATMAAGQYIDLGRSFTGVTAFTSEAWIHPNASLGSGTWPFGNNSTLGGFGGVNLATNGTPYLDCEYYNGTSETIAYLASATQLSGNTHHVACTHSAGTANLSQYLDGAATGATVSGSAADPANAGQNFAVAALLYNTTTGYAGWVDELRLSNVQRSAAWIGASYNTQYSPSTFYTLGSLASQ